MKPNAIGQPWPDHGLEAVTACPVCGNSQRSTLYDDLTDRVFFCAPGTWSLHECNGCRSAYLDPRPTPETIYLAYQDYYTHKVPVQRAAPQGLRGMRYLRRVLANGYMNHRFGTCDAPASVLGVLAAHLLPSQKEILDRNLRHLPSFGSGRRVLDVGFGNGGFLQGARRAGWIVSGADPDPVAVHNAKERGLDVRHGGIEAYADQPASFDVITMSHVIEHVHDPVYVLRQAHALLKPGGQLWLDTPNIRSNGHRLFRRSWLHLDPPRHLVLFSWGSMRRVLNQLSFIDVKRHVFSQAVIGSFAKSNRVAKRTTCNVYASWLEARFWRG